MGGDIMVCYICGKPASFCCPICERYVCNEHTNGTKSLGYCVGIVSGYICSSCFKLAVEEKKQEQQKKYYATHYCDLHKCFHDDKYLKSDRWKSGLGIVICYSEEGDCYSWENHHHKQFCVDSAIQGTTETFEGWDPEWDRYADVLVERTNYLCPYCKHVIFVYERIYEGDNKGPWWSPHRYLFRNNTWARKWT